ncbi:MAG TPA: VOC family protein [Myxococcota bacterium]|nr:VOC family protein [Myxococcota bacterium]
MSLSSSVVALGYVVIESAQSEAWRRFGAEVLGAAVDSDGKSLQLRLDDRPYRMIVIPSEREHLHSVGWEVRDAASLEALVSSLESAGVECERASAGEAFRRRVGDLVRLRDPSGNRLELFHSPLLANTRFVSPAGVSGFVTGDMGLGHVVMPAPNYQETTAFYEERLGFQLSDRMRLGTDEDGAGGVQLRFYHCNPRHHSLALMQAPHPAGLVHLMVEVPDLDEVGYALDRCQRGEVPISATLGRHTNDKMVSFYMKTPSGFDIEYGFGGVRLDVGCVSTSEITSVSDWGHDFSVGFRK